jgi:hypothetical protein
MAYPSKRKNALDNPNLIYSTATSWHARIAAGVPHALSNPVHSDLKHFLSPHHISLQGLKITGCLSDNQHVD